MILNIFVLTIIFIPFWTALIYKHTHWWTTVCVFIWCSIVSFILFMLCYTALLLEEAGHPIDWFTITLICAWFTLCQYVGLKAVFSDAPQKE